MNYKLKIVWIYYGNLLQVLFLLFFFSFLFFLFFFTFFKRFVVQNRQKDAERQIINKSWYSHNYELLSFLCLMAYQPSWVISCQSHPCKRTVVLLFNPYGISPKDNSGTRGTSIFPVNEDAEYTDWNFCRGARLLQETIRWWHFKLGALGNVKYPFTAITPRSTLFQSGSMC